MNPILTVGIVVFNKRREILLVRHTEKAGHLTGTYGLPAGRINSGETAIGAARRELQEETGLKAESLIDYPGNVYFAKIQRKHGKINFSWHVFICTKFSGEIKVSEETIPEWVEISELDSYNLLANTKQAIEDGKKYLIT